MTEQPTDPISEPPSLDAPSSDDVIAPAPRLWFTTISPLIWLGLWLVLMATMLETRPFLTVGGGRRTDPPGQQGDQQGGYGRGQQNQRRLLTGGGDGAGEQYSRGGANQKPSTSLR